MSFLDDIVKQATGGKDEAGGLGAIVSMVSQNPQILSALSGLLSSRDASVGGHGGLAGLVAGFQKNGLGDVVSGWISTGPNPPVTPTQVSNVLGQETLGQFAKKAGVPVSQASSLLAGLLPAAIDRLTPDGKIPEKSSLESSLGSLVSGLLR
jgi:uncharacterized protein YidB (DUF937 family)